MAAIGDAQVFAGYDTDNPHVTAFDLETGKRLWVWEDDDDSPGVHRVSYIMPVGDRVVVGTLTGTLLMDAATGEVVARTGG